MGLHACAAFSMGGCGSVGVSVKNTKGFGMWGGGGGGRGASTAPLATR